MKESLRLSQLKWYILMGNQIFALICQSTIWKFHCLISLIWLGFLWAPVRYYNFHLVFVWFLHDCFMSVKYSIHSIVRCCLLGTWYAGPEMISPLYWMISSKFSKWAPEIWLFLFSGRVPWGYINVPHTCSLQLQILYLRSILLIYCWLTNKKQKKN